MTCKPESLIISTRDKAVIAENAESSKVPVKAVDSRWRVWSDVSEGKREFGMDPEGKAFEEVELTELEPMTEKVVRAVKTPSSGGKVEGTPGA